MSERNEMTQFSKAPSIADWITRLGDVLAEATGGRPVISQVATSEMVTDKPVVWWRASGVPPICVGITEPDAASLLQMRGDGSQGQTPESARTGFADLLTRSWGRGAITAQNTPDPASCEIYRAELASGGNLDFFVAESDTKAHEGSNLDMLMDIELPVTLRFGSAQMALRDIVGLSAGSVVEFDRAVDDPVEIMVSGRVVARGEAVVVQGAYGVRVLEISSRNERLLTSSLAASKDKPVLTGEQNG